MNSPLPHPDIQRGDALRDSGALNEAIAVYREIIAATPDLAQAHYKLGTTLDRLERKEEAEACYREALHLQPGYPEAANNLGILLEYRGMAADAERLYRDALSQRIDYFEAHLNLGDLLASSHRRTEALYHAQCALQLRPDSAQAHGHLGALLFELGKITDAADSLHKALELDSNHAIAWAYLARCHMARGDMTQSEQCNRRAIALDPNVIATRQNLVLGFNYQENDRDLVFREHIAFGRHLLDAARAGSTPHTNILDPARRLRVGFVSGDFRRHSVSHFVAAPIAGFDPTVVETWAYYNHPQIDYQTRELQALFTEWRDIHKLNDEQVAQLIRRDGIDILIDLSGATGNARLEIFARKPAPIQITWIGYPNTTGLSTIDYRFTDAHADPVGCSERFYSETLVRLPDCFLCYAPPKEAPPVSPPPYLNKGFVRFGSFNGRLKIGDQTLHLWRRVLEAVPDAHFVVKSVGTFDTEAGREEFIDALQQAGIAAERVTLHPGKHSLAEHLAAYSEIDIALDTYPYHGTTTTCEALWMGVPVVTLAGDRHVSRVGVSLLSNVGLQELIAHDVDEYVRIASALANDRTKLAEWRTGMRQRLLASSLLDGTAMARKLERTFRDMWSTYCHSHRSQAQETQLQSDRLVVNMQGGYRLCVAPNTKSHLSTWVALEQEDWFEDEIRFVRKLCTSSWKALDVGANHGVYALGLATCGARVWAVEPAGEPRRRLRDSVQLNCFSDRIRVLPLGLSSSPGEVIMEFSEQSEWKSLHTMAARSSSGQEVVRLAALDDLIGKEIPADAVIDFIKLDAEGEETAILRGGLRFFCRQSPLVMYSCRHRGKYQAALTETFRAMGYGIYRLLPELDCLVPLTPESEATLSPFTQNLFACKDNVANKLETSEHLLKEIPLASEDLDASWLSALEEIPALNGGAVALLNPGEFDSDYGRALIAWCGSRHVDESISRRYGRLAQALEHLQQALAHEDAHPAVAVLAIRICNDLDMRVEAVNVASAFLGQMAPDEVFPLDRPVPPAYAAFDACRPRSSLGALLYQSVLEFFIHRSTHSSFFYDPDKDLLKLGMSSPERSRRLERAAWLVAQRLGYPQPRQVPVQLMQSADDNLNPKLWRALSERNDEEERTDCQEALELLRSGKIPEALSRAESVINRAPCSVALLHVAANAAKAIGRLDYAESLWRKAIVADPEFAEAYNDFGIMLMETMRHAAAEDFFAKALAIRPNLAPVYNNLGLLLMALRRYEEAESAYRHLLALQPKNAEAYCNLGALYKETKRFDLAEEVYRRAIEIRPDFGNAACEAYFCASQVCDWTHREYDEKRLVSMVRQSTPDISPFVLLSLGTLDGYEAALFHLKAARLYGSSQYSLAAAPRSSHVSNRPKIGRLRIGYLSSDFHEHATMHLLGGVLSLHDRERFHIHAYSYGTIKDHRTSQAGTACETFKDVSGLSDLAIAELIADDDIDILVDLKGYTQNTRLELNALRPAPITISWLGYPGTLGDTRLADYIIGDPIVTPPEHAEHFAEKLALLPHCYQPNDKARKIGPKPDRKSAGLPDNGFVFCSFNQSFKINPETFGIWCKLLAAVPGSVLWLLETSDATKSNLRKEAEARGINGDRLFFAPLLPQPEHLGRLQLADLALDTYPYNSHTTASDSLWAGVPLVTRMGTIFASRVAASLLSATGLPELIATTPDAYFSLAKELALSPPKLSDVKSRLANARSSCPLFDTESFTRDLEQLYLRIWEQH